jgi:hypothetical protein
MGKRLAVASAAVAVAALIIGMIAPASSGEMHRRILRLSAPAGVGITFVDVGEEGETVGDYIVFNHPVFDHESGKTAGQLRGDCLFVDLEAGICEGDVTFDLKDGLITVEGPFHLAQPLNEFAVTGGTDAYRTVHGELNVRSTEETNFFTFTLIP